MCKQVKYIHLMCPCQRFDELQECEKKKADSKCEGTEEIPLLDSADCPNHPPKAPKDSPTAESAPQPEKEKGQG